MARRVPSIAGKAPRSGVAAADRALSAQQGATLCVLVDPAPSRDYPDGRVLHATASHTAEGAFARFGLDSGASPGRAAEVGQMLAYRYGLELFTAPLSALASVAEAAPVTESTLGPDGGIQATTPAQ